MSMETRRGDKSEWAPMFAYQPKESDYRKFHPGYLEVEEQELYEKCVNSSRNTGGSESCTPPFQLSDYLDFWTSWYRSLRSCYKAYVAAFDQIFPPPAAPTAMSSTPVREGGESEPL